MLIHILVFLAVLLPIIYVAYQNHRSGLCCVPVLYALLGWILALVVYLFGYWIEQ
jgi:uncharacterized membrane protein YwaF